MSKEVLLKLIVWFRNHQFQTCFHTFRCISKAPPYEDIPYYRRLIGRLLYLNSTRPDITFITQQLSQFLSKPTQTHHNVALRVLKYLKSCPDKGLFFPINSSLHLQGFSDVDWAGCVDTRHSIFGQSFFIGHSFMENKEANYYFQVLLWS